VNGITSPDETLVARFRAAVGHRLAERTTAAQRAGEATLDRDDQMALARRFLNDELERYAGECLAGGKDLLTEDEEEAIAQAVFDRLFELGRLQPLLDDERLTDILCNGHDEVFLVYADGRKVPGPPVASSSEELIEMLREIGRRSGLSEREFNPTRPSLNVPLPDGSRLFAVAWVCDRPCVAIRRHRHLKVTLDDLRRLGAIDEGLEAFLRAAVRSRKQILVCGATAAGKTTMNSIRSWPGVIRSRDTTGTDRPPKRSGRRLIGACRTVTSLVWASTEPRPWRSSSRGRSGPSAARRRGSP
jgi:hypothetical protein